MNAGRVGDVDRRIADPGPVARGLGDGVDLGVDGAEAVLLDLAVRGLRLVHQAADLGAVRHPRGRAVVARGENALVAYDHRADLGPGAGRALRDLARDRE